MAIEWAVVELLGFSETSLRLVPVLAAVASVPLFYFLARRVLGTGTSGLLLAVAMFAVSEAPIRYAAEVKPYATDLAVGLLLLVLAVKWLEVPARVHSLWALAAFAPLAIAVSLPSAFLIATIAAVGLWQVLARREAKLFFAFGGFLTTGGLACAAMAALGQYHALPRHRAYFLSYWSDAFPPSWRDPAALLAWLVRVHTGPMFAYPHGGTRLPWLTAIVFCCIVVGIIVRGRRDLRTTALLVMPFLLAIAAAGMRRYPYGTSVRLAQFLAPSTVLFAAAGAAWVCARLRIVRRSRILIPGLAMILCGVGLARVAGDLTHPYRTPWDRTVRDFARWFWTELGVDSELVCVQTDLGISLHKVPWAYDGGDQYLCYQRIYSQRHRQGRPPRWDSISRARPLCCVLLNQPPENVPAFVEWMASHRQQFSLKEVRRYAATHGTTADAAQTYVVCEFVPVGPSDSRSTMGQNQPRVGERVQR